MNIERIYIYKVANLKCNKKGFIIYITADKLCTD